MGMAQLEQYECVLGIMQHVWLRRLVLVIGDVVGSELAS